MCTKDLFKGRLSIGNLAGWNKHPGNFRRFDDSPVWEYLQAPKHGKLLTRIQEEKLQTSAFVAGLAILLAAKIL